MQESRLFRIVYYLIEKGKSTAPELAQKFEVSARTIYRDIDVISSAGIPIYATQGKNGGIIIDENFTLDRSMLSKKEKALSRALPPLVVLCTLYWAFCLLYLLQRGKKLFVLIIKMVIFQYFP